MECRILSIHAREASCLTSGGMKTPNRALALVTIVSFTTAGCSSPRTSGPVSDTATACSAFTGRIAVVPSSYPHSVGFNRLGTSEEAVEHIPDWARSDGWLAAVGPGPGVMILAIPATGIVLGYTYGAAAGLARSHSREDVATADAALVQSRLAKGLQTRIAEHLCETSPTGRATFFLAQNPNHSDAAQDGADALLELEVLSLHLANSSSWSSRLRLKATAYARLKRASDGRAMDSVVVNFTGARCLSLRDWSANNGQPMRDELDHCARELAMKVAAKLTGLPVTNGSPTSHSLANVHTNPLQP